jgi:hypothetical protein
MTTTIERALLPDETLTLDRSFGVRTIHVAQGRWRILDATGRALGHVTTDASPAGLRFHAQRFHAPTRLFRDVGLFWDADDAVAALRYSR